MTPIFLKSLILIVYQNILKDKRNFLNKYFLHNNKDKLNRIENIYYTDCQTKKSFRNSYKDFNNLSFKKKFSIYKKIFLLILKNKIILKIQFYMKI
jgi:hypothetical protein